MNNCVATLNIPIQSDTVCAFIKQGDTIAKITLDFTDYDIDLMTTSAIVLEIYNNNSLVKTFAVGSGITVLSAKILEIDQLSYAENNLPIGESKGDLYVIDSSDFKQTYLNVIYTITE